MFDELRERSVQLARRAYTDLLIAEKAPAHLFGRAFSRDRAIINTLDKLRSKCRLSTALHPKSGICSPC
jgi:hypothetical protein